MSAEKPSIKDEKAAKKAEDGKDKAEATLEKEFGGFEAEGLPEPTRFGDWEVKGRCSDF